jgi:hypothetical protein
MIFQQWESGRRRSPGADKAHDAFDFVDLMRELEVTPHVTQNLTRPGGSAIDARTTREDYAMTNPRTEPAFGWLTTIAQMRPVKLRGDPSAASSCLRITRGRASPCAGGRRVHARVRQPRWRAVTDDV